MPKNFTLVKKNIDINVFMSELEAFLKQGGPWSMVRSNDIEVQRETKHIDIRRAVLGKPMTDLPKKTLIYEAANSEYHELHFKNYPYFIKTYEYLEKFADEVEGQLTRAIIVSLAPKSKVYPHIDWGNYYIGKNRYHIPIKTTGSINICEGEQQIYQEGELWWFDNKKEHEAYNPSDEERIHIIFDILPKKRTVLKKTKDYLEKKMSCLGKDLRLAHNQT